MSTLTVLAFPNEQEANQMMGTLKGLQAQNLLKVEDAAVLTRKPNGNPKIHQAHDLVGAGALGGAFWGMLVGLLFFSPLLGAAVGAGVGALMGKMTDIGIDDNFIKQVGNQIQPGQAGVFLLTRDVVMDKVADAIKSYNCKMIYTSLSKEDEAHLRETLDV